jgi:alkylation response protein AidB-like acyl-CoA dehydrogenase
VEPFAVVYAQPLHVSLATNTNDGRSNMTECTEGIWAQSQAASQVPVALAGEFRPFLARNAAQAERERRLPEENIEALEAANLFKLMTPQRLGAATECRSRPH